MPLTIVKHKALCGVGGVVEGMEEYLPIGKLLLVAPNDYLQSGPRWIVGSSNTANSDTENFDIDLHFFYDPYYSGKISQLIGADSRPYYVGLVQLIRYTINRCVSHHRGCPLIETFAGHNLDMLPDYLNNSQLIHTWPYAVAEDKLDTYDVLPLGWNPWYAFWEQRHRADITAERLSLFPQPSGGVVRINGREKYVPFTFRCATIQESLTLHPTLKRDDIHTILKRMYTKIVEYNYPRVDCQLSPENPNPPCCPSKKITFTKTKEGYEIPNIPCGFSCPAMTDDEPPLCFCRIPQQLADALLSTSPQPLNTPTYRGDTAVKKPLSEQSVGERERALWAFLMERCVPKNPVVSYANDFVLNGCLQYFTQWAGRTEVEHRFIMPGVACTKHHVVSSGSDDPEEEEEDAETYFIVYHDEDGLWAVVIPKLAPLLEWCYLQGTDPQPVVTNQRIDLSKTLEFGAEINTYPLLYCPETGWTKLIDDGIFIRVVKRGTFGAQNWTKVILDKTITPDKSVERSHLDYDQACKLVDAYIRRSDKTSHER